MGLDARTLMAIVAALFALSALFLLMSWRANRQLAGLTEWTTGLGICAVGSLLLIARGHIPDILSILAGNVLLTIGFAVIAVGNRKYMGATSLWAVVVVVLALAGSLALLYDEPNQFQNRVIAFSTSLALLSFCGGWPLARRLQSDPEEVALARRMVATAFIANGLVCLARAAFELTWLPAENRTMWVGEVTTLYYFWTVFIVFSMAAGFPMLVAERLRNQLRDKVKELEASHRTAEDALREHRNFLAMISHEFRNPLSIVNASTEVIACNLTPEEAESAAEISRIRRATRRLSNMVEGCLTDQWLMAEALDMRATTFDIRKVLEELAAEYGVSLNWQGGRLSRIDGDRYLLPVALSSVIENACKYGKSVEGVAIDACARSENTSDDGVSSFFVIDIHDDGPGIPKEERARVFEKYYRAPQGLYRSGSGLGLFLARSILEMHGGSIDVVDPMMGSHTTGCTVRMKLPCSFGKAEVKLTSQGISP